MKTDQHMHKAARILSSVSNLPAENYVMFIEAAMLAGTHLLNAVLHEESINSAEDDALHAEYMTLALRTRVQLQLPGLVEALDAIEQSRPFFVRGSVAGGQDAAQAAMACLQRIQRFVGAD